ncbi:MAG TPA: 50S ribosomal protein L16 [Fusobacteria bacterium]|nr:50S ribosomal protein L16 [Fusobacteriota bacterium]|tara:strand:+ start:27479 stop:27904 length:426 start_codon:yes stop_codon:yes gene_type:complete
MLMPKRTKYRKSMRNSRALKRNATRGNSVKFGEFGLQALEGDWISSRQIEAVRVAINRELKKMGKVVIRIFPHKPYTKKPLEVRMGSGKGNVEKWVAVVKPGTVMFEVAGVSAEKAKEAFRKASHKLPIKVHMISRTEEQQ